MRLSRSRKRSTLAHPNLSTSNLIGTKKRHTFDGCYPTNGSTQAAESDLQRDRRCNAPEACAGRRRRLTQRRDGSDSPVRQPLRREGFYTFGNRERNEGSGCYSVLEATKGSVDCVHRFRRPLPSSQERPSLQAPPPQAPPDPTAPPPYEEPPRPIPIPRPEEPPVVDDPPRRNM